MSLNFFNGIGSRSGAQNQKPQTAPKKLVNTSKYGFMFLPKREDADAAVSYFEAAKQQNKTSSEGSTVALSSDSRAKVLFKDWLNKLSEFMSKKWRGGAAPSSSTMSPAAASLQNPEFTKVTNFFSAAYANIFSCSFQNKTPNDGDKFDLFENIDTSKNMLTGKLLLKFSDNMWKLIFLPHSGIKDGAYDVYGVVLEEYPSQDINNVLTTIKNTSKEAFLNSSIIEQFASSCSHQVVNGQHVLGPGGDSDTFADMKANEKTGYLVGLNLNSQISDYNIFISCKTKVDGSITLSQNLIDAVTKNANLYLVVKDNNTRKQIINQHSNLKHKIVLNNICASSAFCPIVFSSNKIETNSPYLKEENENEYALYDLAHYPTIDGRPGSVGELRGMELINRITEPEIQKLTLGEYMLSRKLPSAEVMSQGINESNINAYALYIYTQLQTIAADTDCNMENVNALLAPNGFSLKASDNEYKYALYLSLAKFLLGNTFHLLSLSDNIKRQLSDVISSAEQEKSVSV